MPTVHDTKIAAVDGYLTSAISTFNGLQALAEAPRLGLQDMARNCSLLAAFSVECVLKHYLARHNVPEKTIRNYRHDLVKLWTAASGAGLGGDPSAPWWCQKLNAITEGPLFFARYGYDAAGALVLPPELLIVHIDELIRSIYPSQQPLLPRLDGSPRITLPT